VPYRNIDAALMQLRDIDFEHWLRNWLLSPAKPELSTLGEQALIFTIRLLEEE
jgi:hypothetical protein